MTAGRQRLSRASAVLAITPLPLAWRAARKLAGGDVRRLVTVSRTTVLVANSERHARRLRRQVAAWQ